MIRGPGRVSAGGWLGCHGPWNDGSNFDVLGVILFGDGRCPGLFSSANIHITLGLGIVGALGGDARSALSRCGGIEALGNGGGVGAGGSLRAAR